jgi:hypothetical protein
MNHTSGSVFIFFTYYVLKKTINWRALGERCKKLFPPRRELVSLAGHGPDVASVAGAQPHADAEAAAGVLTDNPVANGRAGAEAQARQPAARPPVWDRASLALFDPATTPAARPAAVPAEPCSTPPATAAAATSEVAVIPDAACHESLEACEAACLGAGAGAAPSHPSPRPPSAAPPDGAPSLRPRGSIRITPAAGAEAGGGAAPRSPAQAVPAGLDAASRHSMEQAVAPKGAASRACPDECLCGGSRIQQ